MEPKSIKIGAKIIPKLKKWCPWGGFAAHGAQGRLQVAAGGKTYSPFGALLAQNGRPDSQNHDAHLFHVRKKTVFMIFNDFPKRGF